MWIIVSRLRNSRMVTRITRWLRRHRTSLLHVEACLLIGINTAFYGPLVGFLTFAASVACLVNGHDSGYKTGVTDGYASSAALLVPNQNDNAR